MTPRSKKIIELVTTYCQKKGYLTKEKNKG